MIQERILDAMVIKSIANLLSVALSVCSLGWAGLDGGIQYDVFNMNMKPDMIHCLAHTPLYHTVMSPYNRCLDCFRLMASGIGGLSD